MAKDGPGKKQDDTAREAALYDPDSVFHDFAAQTTADRAVQALTATEAEAGDPEADKAANLYAPTEKKRPGALTKEMIKRIADRAEQAAKDKQ